MRRSYLPRLLVCTTVYVYTTVCGATLSSHIFSTVDAEGMGGFSKYRILIASFAKKSSDTVVGIKTNKINVYY